jgi:hypothetical protein
MTQTPGNQTGKFGIDDVVFFFGQVEDVNDPKRSGRVRVRCIGWHPKGKEATTDGVPTECLPWSHVELPATSSGQNRVGNKHRLQEGDFVRGYFADGRDAQHPVIVATINFTANVTTKNLRDTINSSGKLPSDIDGFTLVQAQEPNTGISSDKELKGEGDDKKDKSHHIVKDDSDDGDCPQDKSAFSDRKVQEFTIDIPYSQVWDSEIADALCGSSENLRNIVASKIDEFIPPNINRFLGVGNLLFSDRTGQRTDLNLILKKVAQVICANIKSALQIEKSKITKNINNPTYRTVLLGSSSRSPNTIQLADFNVSLKYDVIDCILQEVLDTLCDVIYNALLKLNNQQQSSQDNNLTSDISARPDTSINNTSSLCITDSLLNTIDQYFLEKVAEAEETSGKQYEKRLKKAERYRDRALTALAEDFTCVEDYNDEMKEMYDDIDDRDDPEYITIDSNGNANFSAFDIMTGVDFTLDLKVLNKCGLGSLSLRTRGGCNPYTVYNTLGGLVSGVQGVSLGFGSGGGSESGKSSKRDKDMKENIGFGGVPKDIRTTVNDLLCPEATTKTIKQCERRDILDSMNFWAPVDYYEPGRTYNLKGEKTINGRETKKSRVLVADQNDPSENGIYITGKKEWKRAPDANQSKEFKQAKVVEVKALPDRDNLYVYVGKDNPKIDRDDLEFVMAYSLQTILSPSQLYALDPFVEDVPCGDNGTAITISVPSSDETQAQNYEDGVPNGILITNTGYNYFFDGKIPGRSYPSVTIQGYAGTPTPVVDERTGELVSILVNPNTFSDLTNPSVSIIPDDSSIGISSSDERYNLVVVDIYVENTGRNYCDPTIKIIDKDTGLENGKARVILKEGRVVDVEVINSGTGFKRIPEVIIEDPCGFGAVVYPIMGLESTVTGNNNGSYQETVHISLCPSRSRVNYAS